MRNSVQEVREWHRIRRDPTDAHWRDVDLLLSEMDEPHGDFKKVIAALEDAQAEIDEAIARLAPKHRRAA